MYLYSASMISTSRWWLTGSSSAPPPLLLRSFQKGLSLVMMAGYHKPSGSNRLAQNHFQVNPEPQRYAPHTGVVLRFTPSFKSLGKQLWTWRNSAAASCSGLYVFSVTLSLARAYMDSSSRAPLEDCTPFKPTTGEFSRDASVEWELACDVRRR